MASHNIIYVTRDIERALGKLPKADYSIITNKTPYALEIQKKYPDNVWLIDSPEILDTYKLLTSPEVQKILSSHNSELLVFKNTIHIEQLCKEKNWKLLNSSAELSEKIENKITQVAWLGELATLLPPHSITLIKDVKWNKKPFILQWSHGHTGDGTILISNENNLKTLKEKFSYREARITNFIGGPMFTVNIIVNNSKILIGNISYQITGMLPFTENAFSTIGNDWAVSHNILSKTQIEQLENIAKKIGEKMRKDGWKGLLGIDVIYNEEKDMFHLIEINPRQPASTTFESELQSKVHEHSVSGLTIFEAHILALTDCPIDNSLIAINDGAQILQRVTSKVKTIDESGLLKSGYKVIKYPNTKLNSDLLRIQSEKGIMERHNKFNKRGKEILELITKI